MIIILFKSLGKRTSIGSYYDEKSLTKCYWDGYSGSVPIPAGFYPLDFGFALMLRISNQSYHRMDQSVMFP